ncbi:MAG: type II secretion system F family protein [Planctomycetes bacterium]|nr:type II secretion system F family protein [Planctomycetota bacterium]
MPYNPLVTSIAAFGLVMAVAYCGLLLAYHRRSALDDRIAELMAEKGGRVRKSIVAQSPAGIATRRRLAARKPVPEGRFNEQACQLRLIQAGIYHPHAMRLLLGAKISLVVVPVLGALVAAGYRWCSLSQGMAVGAALGCAGLLLPDLFLNAQIRNRHTMLRRSLPDFLDLMIICIEGGLSIQAAIQRVTDELRVAHPVLAGEFAIVQNDTELGSTVDLALRRFADRTGYEGIRTLATFVREAQRYGTALAQALRDHAEMLRNQRELAAEESAQKASVKVLFPMLVFILPAVFVVLVGPAAVEILEAFSK